MFDRVNHSNAGGEPTLPSDSRELFFDIELDPMRDICYLHGFVERMSGSTSTERYVAFYADDRTQESERAAFARLGQVSSSA